MRLGETAAPQEAPDLVRPMAGELRAGLEVDELLAVISRLSILSGGVADISGQWVPGGCDDVSSCISLAEVMR